VGGTCLAQGAGASFLRMLGAVGRKTRRALDYVCSTGGARRFEPRRVVANLRVPTNSRYPISWSPRVSWLNRPHGTAQNRRGQVHSVGYVRGAPSFSPYRPRHRRRNRVRTAIFCAYFLDYENHKSVAQFAGAAGFNHRH
jgi:hypothetical protein